MKHLLTLLLLCSLTQVAAQNNLDEMLLKRTAPDCRDIAFNAAKIISRCFTTEQFDSISTVINRWEEYCGETEASFRIKILDMIRQGEFTEDSYPPMGIFQIIITYINRKDILNNPHPNLKYGIYNREISYIYPDRELDLVTVIWASSLLENKNLTPTEEAFCLLYSDRFDDFWDYLADNELKGTGLKHQYEKRVNHTKKMIDGNVGFMTGIYIPQSDLMDVIGIKSIWGLQCGLKYRKMQYDITLALRPGKAKRTYEVIHKGELTETRDHLGGYVGLDFSFELKNNYKRELDLLGGIGYDWITAISYDKKTDTDAKMISSPNLNLGLGYRFYFKNMNYIGIQARYNFIDYKNEGGTTLDGNYVSAMVTYNMFGNLFKYHSLEQMRLK